MTVDEIIHRLIVAKSTGERDLIGQQVIKDYDDTLHCITDIVIEETGVYFKTKPRKVMIRRNKNVRI